MMINRTDIEKAQMACNSADQDYMSANKVVHVMYNWVAVSEQRTTKFAAELTSNIVSRIAAESLLNTAKSKLQKVTSNKTQTRLGSYILSSRVLRATNKVRKLEQLVLDAVDKVEATKIILERCNDRSAGNKQDLEAALKDKERKNTTMNRAQVYLIWVSKDECNDNRWI